MIGIIGAMDEEINELLKLSKFDIKKKKINNIVFFETMFYDTKVVILLSGIGKVNSAISTTILLQNYNINKIINIGSCGASYGSIGDIIISTKTIYNDFDLTVFNYNEGQVPNLPQFFNCSQYLLNKIKKIDVHSDFLYGIISSGDKFITNNDNIIKTLGYDMEAASISHTCYIHNIEFIIIRSISDVFNNNNHIDFKENLKLASKRSANIVNKLLKII